MAASDERASKRHERVDGSPTDADALGAAVSSGPIGAAAASAVTCPITLTLVKDPVFASDGFVYERDAITSWMAAASRRGIVCKSPMTRRPLSGLVFPAPAMQSLANALREAVGAALVASPAVTARPSSASSEEVSATDEEEDIDMLRAADPRQSRRARLVGLTSSRPPARRESRAQAQSARRVRGSAAGDAGGLGSPRAPRAEGAGARRRPVARGSPVSRASAAATGAGTEGRRAPRPVSSSRRAAESTAEGRYADRARPRVSGAGEGAFSNGLRLSSHRAARLGMAAPPPGTPGTAGESSQRRRPRAAEAEASTSILGSHRAVSERTSHLQARGARPAGSPPARRVRAAAGGNL